MLNAKSLKAISKPPPPRCIMSALFTLWHRLEYNIVHMLSHPPIRVDNFESYNSTAPAIRVNKRAPLNIGQCNTRYRDTRGSLAKAFKGWGGCSRAGIRHCATSVLASGPGWRRSRISLGELFEFTGLISRTRRSPLRAGSEAKVSAYNERDYQALRKNPQRSHTGVIFLIFEFMSSR